MLGLLDVESLTLPLYLRYPTCSLVRFLAEVGW